MMSVGVVFYGYFLAHLTYLYGSSAGLGLLLFLGRALISRIGRLDPETAAELAPAAPDRIEARAEVNLLLERFLERGFPALDAGQLAAFDRLLDAPDQDLLAWLTCADPPSCGAHAAIVQTVRNAVTSAEI